MKLLFDENLSFKLCSKLQDIFPGSQHVRNLGLECADDTAIWAVAKNERFVIITKDADFNNMSVIHGHPPHIIWLRTGNAHINPVETLLRSHLHDIEQSISQGVGIVEIS